MRRSPTMVVRHNKHPSRHTDTSLTVHPITKHKISYIFYHMRGTGGRSGGTAVPGTGTAVPDEIFTAWNDDMESRSVFDYSRVIIVKDAMHTVYPFGYAYIVHFGSKLHNPCRIH